VYEDVHSINLDQGSIQLRILANWSPRKVRLFWASWDSISFSEVLIPGRRRIPSSEMWCVALVRTDVFSIIRVERISELGTTLAVTSNRSILRRNTNYMERIGELGTTSAVTSNWSTLRRNTNYMESIGELGTTLAVTSNRSTLQRNTNYMERIGELGTALAVTSNRSILRRNTNYEESIGELGTALAVTSN
jgi:hypothetical protein